MPVAKKVKKTSADPTVEKERKIPDNYVKINSKEHLSTKGVSYETDIYARSLTGSEAMQLADIDDENVDDIIDSILEKNLWFSNADFKYENIFTADKLNIVFFIRVLTYKDPNFIINHNCILENDDGKECGAANQIHFTMEDVNINYLKTPLKEEDLYITTEDKIKISFNLIDIKTERYIAEMIEPLKKSIDKYKKKYIEDLAILSLMVDFHNDLYTSPMQKYNYLNEKLSAVDLIKLKSKLKKLECGIDPLIKSTCSECGGEGLIPVMFSSEFFLPTYK